MKLIAFLALFSFLWLEVKSEFFTSVWCHGSHQSHRHCAFRNLCYSPSLNQFLFFNSLSQSVIAGVDNPGEQIRLARLSSLEGLEDNEDDLYMDYTMLPSYLSQNYDVQFQDQHTIIVKRWRPDRIQNVFHDDLIPIFFTMKYLCHGNVDECLEKYQIVVADAQGKSSPYEDLYAKILSPAKISYLREQQAETNPKKLICYNKLSVGLETETLWYDYGFYLNGKEGSRENPNLRPSYLEEFRNFALRKLGHDSKKDGPDVVVILPEVKSRLQNPDKIIESITKTTKRINGENSKVDVIQYDPSKIEELLLKAAGAKMLVGMTEGSLIASLFMPKASAVVEMFPYGLGPDNSAFIQTLATVRGLAYQSWVNHLKKNTVGHPENEPEQGGLMHLDQKVRKAIEKMDKVGDVPCCNDPAFLHKFYQDTTVDIASFEMSILNGFEDIKDQDESVGKASDEWMLPSKIFNAICKIKKTEEKTNSKAITAEVSWKEPLNLEYIRHKSVVYEVTVQADLYSDTAGSEIIGEYSTNDKSVSFEVPTAKLRKYRAVKVWIAVILDHDLRGSDTFVNCNLDSSAVM